MRKGIFGLVVVLLVAGCGTAVAPVANSARTAESRTGHTERSAQAKDLRVAARLSIRLPTGWEMLTAYTTLRSAHYLSGHFAPQDGQAQMDVTPADVAASAICDEERAYAERNGGAITVPTLPDLPDGACVFSWVNAERNRSGTVLVMRLPTTGQPPLNLAVTTTGFNGNEANLAAYAQLIATAVTTR